MEEHLVFSLLITYSHRTLLVVLHDPLEGMVVIMSKRSVAVLFGGNSSEYEVSLMSAASVLSNIPTDRYQIHMVGITKEGQWIYYTGPVDEIQSGVWCEHPDNRLAWISPDSTAPGLMVASTGGNRLIPLDVVFPVLHGKNGEDGSIQGLMQLAGIPCVGCSMAASAVCMDKVYTNMVLDSAGIPQAKWDWCHVSDYRSSPREILDRVEKLGYPVFVKPANAGSSVGVGKAKDRASLKACIQEAAKWDQKLLFEEGIDGIEVECAVLGNQCPIASVVGEISPCNEFYDYEAKYEADSQLFIPARLPEETSELIRQTAVKAFRALDCSGLARVDFFVRRSDGAVLLNEPNTIPGFTSISMYPKLFDASGLPYPKLLDRLLGLAMERTGR